MIHFNNMHRKRAQQQPEHLAVVDLLPHLASLSEWMGLTDRLIHLIAQQELLMGVVELAKRGAILSALNPR
jgi:hypothetical protein